MGLHISIKNRLQKLIAGFSLIELMVVVAIIGVLASIAVPAYDGYMTKARISHIVEMGGQAKGPISEFRVTQGTFPSSLTSVFNPDLSASEQYVSAVNGPATCTGSAAYTFVVVGKGAVSGVSVGYTANWTAATATSAAKLAWSCVYSGAYPASYFPPECTAGTPAAACS